ncbi:hypothetical protein C8J57DRAFT_376774 [Mycena rebaudengoi]|nr:hypothetical protein C8J57DRAFT_376774 [Mycena rebaudengoi]
MLQLAVALRIAWLARGIRDMSRGRVRDAGRHGACFSPRYRQEEEQHGTDEELGRALPGPCVRPAGGLCGRPSCSSATASSCARAPSSISSTVSRSRTLSRAPRSKPSRTCSASSACAPSPRRVRLARGRDGVAMRRVLPSDAELSMMRPRRSATPPPRADLSPSWGHIGLLIFFVVFSSFAFLHVSLPLPTTSSPPRTSAPTRSCSRASLLLLVPLTSHSSGCPFHSPFLLLPPSPSSPSCFPPLSRPRPSALPFISYSVFLLFITIPRPTPHRLVHRSPPPSSPRARTASTGSS